MLDGIVPRPPFTEADLAGRYQMGLAGTSGKWFGDAGDMPDLFFHRTYTFRTTNQFEVHYVFFKDSTYRTPTISSIWTGRYWLLEPHTSLPNTRLADFRLDLVHTAILDPVLLAQVATAGTPLGLYLDITHTGLPDLGPLFAPLVPEQTDYDIVSLSEGRLMTGLRSAAMMAGPEGRPTRLQRDLPAIRQAD